MTNEASYRRLAKHRKKQHRKEMARIERERKEAMPLWIELMLLNGEWISWREMHEKLRGTVPNSTRDLWVKVMNERLNRRYGS